MYKNLILIFIFFMSCKEVSHKEKIVFYTDSSFKHIKDSVFVDSISQVKQEAYCRVYHKGNSSFEQGKLNNGVKVGVWQGYLDMLGEKKLDEERIYLTNGELRNYKVFDHITKQVIEDKNYTNNNLVGIQKEFYPSGKLHIQYETDKEGNYINDFIVLSETGKEIFISHLGKEGSGYIKYYDKQGNIEWEGLFKNKKKEGWHDEYVIGYGGKEIEKVSTLYKEGKAIQTKK